jgi:hypothetical protein
MLKQSLFIHRRGKNRRFTSSRHAAEAGGENAGRYRSGITGTFNDQQGNFMLQDNIPDLRTGVPQEKATTTYLCIPEGLKACVRAGICGYHN